MIATLGAVAFLLYLALACLCLFLEAVGFEEGFIDTNAGIEGDGTARVFHCLLMIVINGHPRPDIDLDFVAGLAG